MTTRICLLLLLAQLCKAVYQTSTIATSQRLVPVFSTSTKAATTSTTLAVPPVDDVTTTLPLPPNRILQAVQDSIPSEC